MTQSNDPTQGREIGEQGRHRQLRAAAGRSREAEPASAAAEERRLRVRPTREPDARRKTVPATSRPLRAAHSGAGELFDQEVQR